MLATLFLSAAATLLPEWSPSYFWMWNTRLEPAKLNAQLDDMCAHGLRSVCAHPWPNEFRPNTMPSKMSPAYLSDDYLDVLRQVFDHGAKLGMNLWLYDEGGWPSGGAAGLVVKSDKTGAFCPRFLRPDGQGGFVERLADDYRTKPFAPFPSVLEPGATERFIDITHERLKKAVGHLFGTAVKFTFTDEPCYVRANRGEGFAGLAWASDFAAEFRKRRGYEFEPSDDLLDVKGTVSAKRVDYLETLAELFAERYLAPIRGWCRANGLLSGGHFGGEDHFWECHQHGAGDLLLSLDTLDLPGVDVIWRQLAPGVQPLPFPRFAASVAHQNGQAHVLSESFGVYGNGVTPDLWKWLVDYLLVRGVNTFVFGYLQADNSGPWMTRIEPLGGVVRPEWDFLPPFHEYVHARSAALGRGKSAAETAVLYDVRDVWAGGIDRERAATNLVVVSGALDRRHVEFDFVSDLKLAAAKLGDGRLTVGKMSYRTLVLPYSKWMSAAAKAKVEAFAAAGGQVVRGVDVGTVPATCEVTGEGAGDIRVLKRLTDSGETLFFANESTAPRRVTLTVGGRKVDWAFAGCGSALFVDGRALDEPDPSLQSVTRGRAQSPRAHTDLALRGRAQSLSARITLADGWTLRRHKSYAIGKDDFDIRTHDEPARPTALGDWCGTFGESFSGIAVYRNEFDAKGGRATLDLGRVGWTCRVWLNGRELKPKFFGPFVWTVDLADGRNVLEVQVANTLANATGDLAARDRVMRDFPPKSPYEDRQRVFNQDNHESGLFGPVLVERIPDRTGQNTRKENEE